jgi:hypothetical protein
VGDRGLQRTLVETDLRVGEVVVVEEDEVGLGQADELGHLGEVAVDVELDVVCAHERIALEGVETDAEAVRTDRRVVGGRRLHDREARDLPSASVLISGASVLTPAVSSHFFDHVDRSRPLVASSSRAGRAARCCRRRASGSTRDAGEEGLDAHPAELLEDRAALRVGDAVEVDLDVVRSLISATTGASRAAGPGGRPRSSPSR